MPPNTVSIPVNAAAREIVRRREENVSIDEQMRVLRELQLTNSEVIGGLEHSAIWAAPSTPDAVATEPEVTDDEV